MTEYAHHPDFRVAVEAEMVNFGKQIDEGLQWVADQWDKCVMDSNWGWLSPGLKAAYELAKNKCEEEMQTIVDEFQAESAKIWEAVDKVTGDPLELMEMNAAYIKAAGALRDEKVVIGRLQSSVATHWSGDAFDAYSNMIGEQTNAIAGIDAGISSAATACAKGAMQINNIWNDIVSAILDYASKIVDAIVEGANVGQWVSLEVGPALKVILDAVIEVAKLAVALEKYWAENATVETDMWRQLNSGLGGLDANNKWPRIAYYTGPMGSKDGWQDKSD